jgi:L,D-peptidoglycan transpeptidase YkuD (ErfK/YbiS/YcfS/YnhG family)
MSELRYALGTLLVVGVVGCKPHPVLSPNPASPATNSRAQQQGAYPLPTGSSLQLILVTTADWDSVPGVMRRFERDGVREGWRPVGPEVPVVVGAAGLGWGNGVHGIGSPGEAGPVKHEGDNRSPAGVFRLTSTFGYAPRDSVPWIQMPYTQATDAYKCVDDSASVHYNQMLLRGHGSAVDWHSAEDMHRPDSLYRFGVVVEHNANGRQLGGGSCIFLHIWPGPAGNTAGCTAFASDAMMELLAWLKPDALPILVQLPQSMYNQLRSAWALP